MLHHPHLITPTLGAATATTINNVAISNPGTGATLTIADGKTLATNNSVTFNANDGASVNLGSGGTVLYSGGPLGTPSSATLTNATGLPVSTGISGLGTGVATFLATPTSSNLNSAVTDSTGTGALVFATAPTFTTSVDSGSSTFSAFATPTTLNLGSGATTLSIGYNSGTTTINNNLTVSGNLDVKGTTTYIESTTLQVVDKNIEIGKTDSPTDGAAIGGGITLLGTTNKTINWQQSPISAWTSSENFNLAAGKAYYINGTSVLSGSTLGSSVTGSSLTSVSTLTAGTWNADIISPTYGGTGVNNGTKTITLSGNLATSGANNLTLTTIGTTNVTLPVTGTLSTLNGIETLTNKTLTTPNISTIVNSGTLTLPTSTDTLVGRNTTDTFTNKTFDTAGTGNVLKINGNQISSYVGSGANVVLSSYPTISNATLSNHVTVEGVTSTGATGTGQFVFDTSPTLITPTLGDATANTINNVAITNPGTGATLTIADGKTIEFNNTVTFNANDGATVSFGSGGTVLYSGGPLGTPSSATLTNATGLPVSTGISGLGTGIATFLATPNSANLAAAVTDETGSGLLVFGTSPTLTTPNISTIVNSGTLTLPTSTDTLVGRNTTDTLTHKTYDTAGTSNVFKINGTQITDVTGSGKVVLDDAPTITGHPTIEGVTSTGATGTGQFVFGTSPTLTTPNISTIVNSGTLTLPTSTDTLVARDTTDTLTNKSIDLASNTLTGTIAEFNTALTDGDFATLAGTETLINKTLTTPIIASIKTNSGSATVTLPTSTTTLVGKDTTDTLTNKTYDTAGTGNSFSINGTAITDVTGSGKVVLDTAPTITTPTISGHLTVEGVTSTGATGTGNIVFASSPTLTTPVIASITNGAGTLTLPTSTDTLVGRNTTDTFTHKTFDTAGSGNVFKINGTSITDTTGSGKVVLDTAPTISGHPTIEGVTSTGATGTGNLVFSSSPTLTTPTLGAATATTINKVNITNPGTGATLTIADGKTITANNTLTFNGTDGSSVAFGSGGTVLYSGGPLGTPSSATLTNATGLPVSTGISGLGTGVATFLATPSADNLRSAVTSTTGTGSLVFGTSPTLTTPNISTIVNSGTLTLPTSTDTLVGRNTTDVLTNKSIDLADNTLTGTLAEFNTALTDGDFATLAGIETLTNKTLTSPVISSIVNTGTLTLPTSTTTLIGDNTINTLTNKTFDTAGTGNSFSINGTSITAVTGTGSVVLSSSPTIATPTVTTSLGTTNASFSLINNTATTVNFAGAATTLNIGAGTGTTTINNNLTVSGNLDVKGTTTYIESTTLQVEDKNIEIGKVATPTDSTANGGGISLLGDTTKTFSWYSATGAWTSSENLVLEAGKNLILKGSISGTTTLESNQTAGSTILTLPVSSGDTLIGRATTDTLTNKTFDTAGTGNYLYINGTQITAVSGTGSVILSSSPTIGSPTLSGHATIEGQTLTGVTGTGNLVLASSPTLTSPSFSTIVNSGTLTLPTSTDTLVGKNTIDTLTNKTLTAPNISTIVNSGTLTLPTSTDTLVGRNTTDILTNKTFDITTNTFEYSGTQINNVTGTGKLVLDTAPTISAPTVSGHPTIEGVTSTGATGTGKFVFDHSPSLTTPSFSSIVNSGTLTLPTSTDTLVGRATTDTLTNKTYDTAGTGNLFYINGTAITDVTGSGKVVLDTAPTIDNLSIAGYITSNTHTGGQISWSTDNQTDFQGNIKVGGNVIKSGGGASSITLNNNGFTSPQITASTSVTVQGSADSSSTSTGALTVAGGAGIIKNLNVGGNLNIGGTTTLSGNTQINANLTTTGISLLGDLQISADTISSVSSNANIVLSPNGTGAIDVVSHKIINLTNPTANQDAATKYYVDNSVSNATSFSKYIDFAADSGSLLEVDLGDTLDIKGGTNISTATSVSGGTKTITINNTMSVIDGGNAYGN